MRQLFRILKTQILRYDERSDFGQWIQFQVNSILLSGSERILWERYIQDGVSKGVYRIYGDAVRGRDARTHITVYGTSPWNGSFGDAKRVISQLDLDAVYGMGVSTGAREQFVQSVLSSDKGTTLVALLRTKTLQEVEGMTADLVAKCKRAYFESLLTNEKGYERIVKVIQKSLNRAVTIANTELVRAHAEGQLLAAKQLGIKEVRISAERPRGTTKCNLCSTLAMKTILIEQAHNQIPLHPNCYCCWMVSHVRRK